MAAQYRNLVPQRQHLGSDRRLAAGQDRQPPKQAHREQIQEAKTHDRRACLTSTLLQNSRPTRTREVLERYRYSFALAGQSVAEFYRQVHHGLSAVGAQVTIAHPRPFDLPDSHRPFAEDTEHASYDPAAVTRYWQVLSQVNLLLEAFAANYSGKTSPVHHFWHTFDIAVTRFGDARIEQPATVDPVTREAYSRDVISFGFWFGDESFPEPAFYSYTAPEPPGLSQQPLRPSPARWIERHGSHLAVLHYDDLRALPDPRAAVLEFYESAYQAGARQAGWDIRRWACPGGITDPHLPIEQQPAGPTAHRLPPVASGNEH